ncbi:dynein light chain roadblock-type 2 isoform X1 [Oreochromis niloticus]|uniref:dynein light chain roadblock-type 2 isoform X1 n=1 Tax=Oreochromis niloticus TaxID=8128 RepID=UPI000393CC9A|nr:dynein light chain roadblock-type 2 isoform X1 [Oreochromis niloticus]XP_039471587.1 dynein light chain roadblock-type 2 isoform X1 [Oreochromis aureus]
MGEEVEAQMKRIEATKGVIGTLVVDPDGVPIRSTLDQSMTLQYAGQLRQLVILARSAVRDIDPQNDLSALRVRSKSNEIIVVTENNYLVIGIQKLPEPDVSMSREVGVLGSPLGIEYPGWLQKEGSDGY